MRCTMWQRAEMTSSSSTFSGSTPAADLALASDGASTRPARLRVSPRVDQSDVRVPEVLHVAGGQCGAVRATDGGDLRVEPVNRQSELVTANDELRIVRGRPGVEGQYLILEGREHL